MIKNYKDQEKNDDYQSIVNEPDGWVRYLDNRPSIDYSSNLSHHIIMISRKGIPYNQAKSILGSFGLGQREISNIIGVSARTFQRNLKEDKLLNINQSEKVLEAGALLHKGIIVFGNRNKFLKWMHAPNPVFMGSPLSYIDTNIGINLVIEELKRIEHSIY